MVIPVGPPSGQTILRIVKHVAADGSVTLEREDIFHGKNTTDLRPLHQQERRLHVVEDNEERGDPSADEALGRAAGGAVPRLRVRPGVRDRGHARLLRGKLVQLRLHGDQHRPPGIRAGGHAPHPPAAPRVRRRPDAWLVSSAFALGPSMARRARAGPAGPLQPRPHRHRSRAALVDRRILRHLRPSRSSRAGFSSAPIFTILSSRMHRLYFWNMLGSGLGGLLVLGLMFLVPPGFPDLPAGRDRRCSPRSSAALHWYSGGGHGSASGPWRPSAARCSCAAELPPRWRDSGRCSVSDFKPDSYARKFPDSALLYHAFSPLGRDAGVLQLLLPLRARARATTRASASPACPETRSWACSRTATARWASCGSSAADEEALHRLPARCRRRTSSCPSRKVLILRLGGGAGVQTALHNGARERQGGGIQSRSHPHAARRALLPDVHGQRRCRTRGCKVMNAEVAGIRGRHAGRSSTSWRSGCRFHRALPGGRILGGGKLPLHGGGHPRLPEVPRAVGDPLHHGLGPAEPAAERPEAPVHRGGGDPRGLRREPGEARVHVQPPSLHGNRPGQEVGLPPRRRRRR